MITYAVRFLKTLLAISVISVLVASTAKAQMINQNVQYTKVAMFSGKPIVQDTSFVIKNGTDTLRISIHSDSVYFTTNAGGGYVFNPPISGGSGGSGWQLTGNTGTNSSFLGTTNNKPLVIKTNNTRYALYDSIGRYAHFNDSAIAALLQTYIAPFNLDLYYNAPWASYSTVGDKKIISAISNVATQQGVVYNMNYDGTNFYNYLNYLGGTTDSLGYQAGVWKIASPMTELSIYNRLRGFDESSITLKYDVVNGLPYSFIMLNDSTRNARYINFKNNSVLPDSDVWNLGTAAMPFKKVVSNAIQIKTDAGVGKTLTSDADGNARWGATAFTPADSATIYALTPTSGTTYYCSDCTGNGVTGAVVTYFGAMWRRQKFE